MVIRYKNRPVVVISVILRIHNHKNLKEPVLIYRQF